MISVCDTPLLRIWFSILRNVSFFLLFSSSHFHTTKTFQPASRKVLCLSLSSAVMSEICAASKVPAPRRSPAGHQQRRKSALRAAAGQSKHFPAERLRRAGRHDSAVLHLGTGANQAPPQPPERHADLPGAGVQRLDYPKKAGAGQARPHHAELSVRCKAHRKGG